MNLFIQYSIKVVIIDFIEFNVNGLSRGMVLDCYNPTHQDAIGITLSELSHIDEINLEPLTELT